MPLITVILLAGASGVTVPEDATLMTVHTLGCAGHGRKANSNRGNGGSGGEGLGLTFAVGGGQVWNATIGVGGSGIESRLALSTDPTNKFVASAAGVVGNNTAFGAVGAFTISGFAAGYVDLLYHYAGGDGGVSTTTGGTAGGGGAPGPSGPGRKGGDAGNTTAGAGGGGSNGGSSTAGGTPVTGVPNYSGEGGHNTFGVGGGPAVSSADSNRSGRNGTDGGAGSGSNDGSGTGGDGSSQPLFTDNSGGPNHGLTVGPGGGGGGSGNNRSNAASRGGNGGYGAGGAGGRNRADGSNGGDGYIVIQFEVAEAAPLYQGARSQSQVYLGSRSIAALYQGAGILFPYTSTAGHHFRGWSLSLSRTERAETLEGGRALQAATNQSVVSADCDDLRRSLAEWRRH